MAAGTGGGGGFRLVKRPIEMPVGDGKRRFKTGRSDGSLTPVGKKKTDGPES